MRIKSRKYMTKYDPENDYSVDELDFGGETEEQASSKIKFIDQNIWTKLEHAGKKITFAKDIKALYYYMKDPFVGWHRKAIVVAGLIYFLVPFDAIPDFSPFIGFLDDLGVITSLLKYLGKELVPYYRY
jgi:uncharacterized membrane protein YkvA (DUF1232 family)